MTIMSQQTVLKRLDYVGLLKVTLATLMYEILLTRIFSVITWYHFAFLAISAAMFGMTVGAIVVYLRPAYFNRERIRFHLSVSSLLFSISIVFGFLAELSIPLLFNKSKVDFSLMPFEYLVVSIPFIFSGICVCLALTRFPESISKLYAVDLAGAALGCVLLVWILNMIHGPTAMIVVACLAGMGSISFASGESLKRLRRVGIIWVAVCAGFVAIHTILVHNQMSLLRLSWVKGRFQGPHLYEKWNAFSRIVVDGDSTELPTSVRWMLGTLEMAIEILAQEASDDTKALRDWAIKVIDRHSEVKLSLKAISVLGRKGVIERLGPIRQE